MQRLSNKVSIYGKVLRSTIQGWQKKLTDIASLHSDWFFTPFFPLAWDRSMAKTNPGKKKTNNRDHALQLTLHPLEHSLAL